MNKYLRAALVTIVWSLTGAVAGLTTGELLDVTFWEGALVGAVASAARQIHSMLPAPAGSSQ